MIALAIDENFDHHILRALLRRVPDLDVKTVQQESLHGASDPEVLAWAASEGRVLLTHDVQTVTRFAYDRVDRGEPMPVVIEIPSRATVGEVLDDLVLVVSCSEAADCRDQVIYVPLISALPYKERASMDFTGLRCRPRPGCGARERAQWETQARKRLRAKSARRRLACFYCLLNRRDMRSTTKARATEGVPDLVQLLRTLAVVAYGAVACGPRVVNTPERMTSSSSDVPPPEWPDTAVTDSSRLAFSVEGLEEPSNHTPVLRITLRNPTWDGSLWVKYQVRASVNDAFHRDVLLDVIEGPPLKQITCSHCGFDPGLLESYVELGPQSAISFIAGIYCSPLAPGHYRLVAHYQEHSERPPDFPQHADWFAGTLTSEPFEIDVSPLQRP